MNKKEIFVTVLEDFMSKNCFQDFIADMDEESKKAIISFWDAFKSNKSLGGMTETGQAIMLTFEADKVMTAAEIAQKMNSTSRKVSGAMQKLITDGYVLKVVGSSNPVRYELTEMGKQFIIDNK